jgi:hypothetical protein
MARYNAHSTRPQPAKFSLRALRIVQDLYSFGGSPHVRRRMVFVTTFDCRGPLVCRHELPARAVLPTSECMMVPASICIIVRVMQ